MFFFREKLGNKARNFEVTKEKLCFSLVGTYFLSYEGVPLILCCQGLKGQSNIRIFLLTRNPEYNTKLLKAIKERIRKHDDQVIRDFGCFGIHKFYTSHWESFKPRKYRKDSTLFYNDNMHLTALKDLEDFMSKAQEYHDRGRIHKRAILLSGRPGTGKTTLALWLTQKLGRDVSIFASKDGSGFEKAVSETKENQVLLLEDIDSIAQVASNQPNPQQRLIPYHTLLQLLDGADSKDDQIIVMTTNHPEKFDEAFLRKGRIGAHFTIELPNEDTIQRMYKDFFPDGEKLDLPSKLSIKTADVEEILMCADTHEEAKTNLEAHCHDSD